MERDEGELHQGHRARLRRRARDQGLDGFDDHNVLELLLFYALPRGDTNPLAHRLLDRFGTLAGVLDAPAEELRKVEGVGEGGAALLKLIPQLSRRYLISREAGGDILGSTRAAGRYLVPRFTGERDEVVYLTCLDAKRKVISCRLMFRGGVNSAVVSVRKIVEAALAWNATSVILAHNHTSGLAIPSREDEATTARIREALAAVEVELADHIVVADGDFVSMADNGAFQ